MPPRSCTNLKVRSCVMLCTLFALSCGESDPSEFFRTNGSAEATDDDGINDDSDDALLDSNLEHEGDCPQIEWGFGCKPDHPTYNVTLDAFVTQSEETETISLETLHCDGYESVVLVFGDSECPACPMWYDDMGSITEKIHAAGGVVITSCTSNFGLGSLPNDIAAMVTSDANPDYSTGTSPLQYPCKYDFTPFTMVIDLSDATVLVLDSASDRVTLDDVVDGVEQARNK